MADNAWPGRVADDAWPGAPAEGGAPASDPYLNTPSSFRSLGRGVAQAGMNIVEGPAKLAEDVGIPMPRPQWAVNLKRSVDKDPYARGAEMAAGFGTGFIPVTKAAELTQVPRLVSQYAPSVANLAGRAMAPVSRAWEAIGPAGRGAVIAPLTSPATGEHPWRERAEQAAGGAVLGGAAGRAVRGVEARRAAQASYAQEKASYDALVQARQAAYQQKRTAFEAANRDYPAAQTAYRQDRRAWVNETQANQAAYERQQQAYNAARQAYPGSLSAYQAQRAQWEAANQARQAFRPFDPIAANTEMYRWVGEPVGGLTATRPGPEGLLELRDQIGARLNQTANDMSFYPEPDTIASLYHGLDTSDFLQRHPNFRADFRRIVTGPLQVTQLEDGTFELGRGMSGRQYGDYISSIRQAADRYAQSARGPMGSDPDRLAMAQQLRDVIEQIEDTADAPPGVKEARAQARAAYRRWAIVDNAAPVQSGDIADPGRVLREMDRRMSRGEFVADPMRQRVEAWRQQAETQRPPSPGREPRRPEEPTPPSPPRVRAAPQEPERPTEPTPPSPPRGKPKPPKEPKQASRLKPVLQGAGHLAGLAAGAKVGHPYIGSTLGGSAGAGLANLISGQTGRLGRVVGQFPRSPYGAAILGGQVAPMADPAAQTMQDLLEQLYAQRTQ